MKIACINKIRNEKGVIVKYILEVEDGSKIEATAKQIKEEIKAGNYKFTNLQIDKAGRLVDKAVAKRTPAKKVINKPVSAEDKQKALKKAAREEVKKYIDMMKKSYIAENDGAEKFIRDFTGEGNVIFDKDKNGNTDIKTVCKMTPATKHCFELLIKQIEDKALKDKVLATRYDYTDISVELPESVKEFMQSSGLDNCIAEAMFYQAAQNNKLALVKCGYDDMSDGFVGNMILTANYDKVRLFITKEISKEARNTEQRPKNILLEGNYVQGDNMLGKVFIIKICANLQRHDANYYKDQVLFKACDYGFEDDKAMIKLSKEEQARLVRNALSRSECGLYYLALKLEVLPQRDDWDTPEEKEIEDKITEEAKRLVKSTGSMEWMGIYW